VYTVTFIDPLSPALLRARTLTTYCVPAARPLKMFSAVGALTVTFFKTEVPLGYTRSNTVDSVPAPTAQLILRCDALPFRSANDVSLMSGGTVGEKKHLPQATSR